MCLPKELDHPEVTKSIRDFTVPGVHFATLETLVSLGETNYFDYLEKQSRKPYKPHHIP